MRIFTGRILDSLGCKVSSCGQRRLWSDCVDAQADLSLCWAHMSSGTFSHVAAGILVIHYYVYKIKKPSLKFQYPQHFYGRCKISNDSRCCIEWLSSAINYDASHKRDSYCMCGFPDQTAFKLNRSSKIQYRSLHQGGYRKKLIAQLGCPSPKVIKSHKKGALANSVDPDQTPQNAASDQGIHCLHLKYRNFYKTW